jgi:hypothetical protein
VAFHEQKSRHLKLDGDPLSSERVILRLRSYSSSTLHVKMDGRNVSLSKLAPTHQALAANDSILNPARRCIAMGSRLPIGSVAMDLFKRKLITFPSIHLVINVLYHSNSESRHSPHRNSGCLLYSCFHRRRRCGLGDSPRWSGR